MCHSLLKIMMFAFNAIIFVAGGAVLGMGIWLKVDSESLLGLLENAEGAADVFQIANISYLLMAVGSVLVLIGFLGCCGAMMESKCLLLTFFIVVLVIFLAEVAGAILLLVFNDVADSLLADLEDNVVSNIRQHYGVDDSVTSSWNSTMEAFHCCGYRNFTDFDDSVFLTLNGGLYPDQCCKPLQPLILCRENQASVSGIDGCFNKLLRLLEDNALIVACVALGIAALEVAAMVVSMILYCNVNNKSR